MSKRDHFIHFFYISNENKYESSCTEKCLAFLCLRGGVHVSDVLFIM